jgi:hypothetical protein
MRNIGADRAAFASIEVARTLRKLASAALDDLRGLLIRVKPTAMRSLNSSCGNVRREPTS